MILGVSIVHSMRSSSGERGHAVHTSVMVRMRGNATIPIARVQSLLWVGEQLLDFGFGR